MKISLNWLREYVHLDESPADIAERITLGGLEVEETTPIGSTLDGVVTGLVVTCQPHPNADRLKVTTVDIGTAVLPIVCGAPNVAAGQKVLVATVGTILPITLPDGTNLVIKSAKIRGEVSEGMICAADELGLGDDHSGILVLPDGTPVGKAAKEVMDLYVDHVFEVAITPNRPDATCHLGVARDLSAILNSNLKKPVPADEPELRPLSPAQLRVDIDSPDVCHRYVGVLMTGVTVGPSPKWLQDRLYAIGLRSISNIVDATNYVMMELGQPLHAFDMRTLAGNRIVVRTEPGESTFTTLDGQKRTVPAGTLYIRDGEKPVALAGVMGGLNSEISDSTTDILIESAYFEPRAIRRASKQLGLQTDSSYRFERGIDPAITRKAAMRCAQLIRGMCPGSEVVGGMDAHPVITVPKSIDLRLESVNRTLGMDLKLNQIVSVLRGLEFDVQKQGDSRLTVTVPTFRPDISREIDLVEEVARILDYNKIPNPGKIQFSRPYPLPYREIALRRIREAAVRLGFREMYGNSLLPEAIAGRFAGGEALIHTLNPISRDTTTLRPVLAPGFLRAAAFNANRGASRIRLFEVGNIFRQDAAGTWLPGVHEDTHILLGMSGLSRDAHWTVPETPFSSAELSGLVDAFLEILGLAGRVEKQVSGDGITYRLDGTELGRLVLVDADTRKTFDLSQTAGYFEGSVGRLVNAMEAADRITYAPIPRYPSTTYDIAVVTDRATTSGELEQLIRGKAGVMLRSLTVFDVYEGKNIAEGSKSLGYRLVFRDDEKTLTLKDVDGIISRIVSALESRGAHLRT
jgi:phenylalanyl-tRNA synthetase beta chain